MQDTQEPSVDARRDLACVLVSHGGLLACLVIFFHLLAPACAKLTPLAFAGYLPLPWSDRLLQTGFRVFFPHWGVLSVALWCVVLALEVYAWWRLRLAHHHRRAWIQRLAVTTTLAFSLLVFLIAEAHWMTWFRKYTEERSRTPDFTVPSDGAPSDGQ